MPLSFEFDPNSFREPLAGDNPCGIDLQADEAGRGIRSTLRISGRKHAGWSAAPTTVTHPKGAGPRRSPSGDSSVTNRWRSSRRSHVI
jgi:hypothetical protein